MSKLSLKDLESVIETQVLYASLCIGAQHQVPDEPLTQAFHLAQSTLASLEEQYQKRTNVEKTQRMMKRVEARLGFKDEQESSNNADSSSGVQG